MSKFNIFSIVIASFIALSANVFAQPKELFRIKTVVIDPGHGGRDAGCVYGKNYEKNITLDVSLKLGSLIKKSYPNIKVVYTRSKDVYLQLNQRAKIANSVKGDLFISVHVNSVGGAPSARGVETFTLGMHKSASNLEVAKKENSVIMLENGYEQTYEGFDPNDEESYIMFSLGQHAFQRQSLALSFNIQEKLKGNLPTTSRGMKQAGFWVLWATSMPSILTEIGFLSNAKDRAYLCTDSGRTKIAKSLFEGFENYKNDVEISSTYEYDPDGKDSQVKITSPVSSQPKAKKTITNKSHNSNVYYSLQFFASTKHLSSTASQFRVFKDKVFSIKSKNLYKYYSGKYISYEEILSLQRFIRKNGYKDAFIVAFKDGKLISVDEAKKILK